MQGNWGVVGLVSEFGISEFRGPHRILRIKGELRWHSPGKAGRTRPLNSSNIQEMCTARRFLMMSFCWGTGARLRPGARSLRWSTPGLSLASDSFELNVQYKISGLGFPKVSGFGWSSSRVIEGLRSGMLGGAM